MASFISLLLLVALEFLSFLLSWVPCISRPRGSVRFSRPETMDGGWVVVRGMMAEGATAVPEYGWGMFTRYMASVYMFRPVGEPCQFANRPSDMRTVCDNSYSRNAMQCNA